MCRFASYLGTKKLLLNSVLDKPKYSLIMQSHAAKEGVQSLNADGFGLAWYNQEIDKNPGIFRSTQPAWNDENLKSMANIIESNCFLAHIRAATIGDVSLNNCHPFFYKQHCFVQNGDIYNFKSLKREFINVLNNELLSNIKGQTDSEYFFFLIMHFLEKDNNRSLPHAISNSFQWLIQQQEKHVNNNSSRLNIVISDGNQLIATRYVSSNCKALSVYYLYEKPSINNDDYSIIISSEPLTDYAKGWKILPQNHMLIAKNKSSDIEIKKI